VSLWLRHVCVDPYCRERGYCTHGSRVPGWRRRYAPAMSTAPHHAPHFGHAHGLPVHLRTTDHLAGPGAGWYKRANARLAIWITAGVGSMTCAWLFAALALAGLHQSTQPGNIGLLFWISSDFLQLTLLSVIMVGQNIAALASDARAAKTFEDAEASRVDLITALDRLDCETEGGIKTILDAIQQALGPK
jgi:hypothetical protein